MPDIRVETTTYFQTVKYFTLNQDTIDEANLIMHQILILYAGSE